MKCVMLSIRPKYCELIASGKKTVEVRKTKPKIDVPFKCYIYCTKGDALAMPCLNAPKYTIYRMNNGTIKGRKMTEKEREQSDYLYANGKVIGHFICDEIHDFTKAFFDEQTERDTDEISFWLDQFKLSYSELCSYVGLEDFYGWHITDLVIYEKPKELIEFNSYNVMTYFDDELGLPMPTHIIKRPPQSYMFVEELKGETE